MRYPKTWVETRRSFYEGYWRRMSEDNEHPSSELYGIELPFPESDPEMFYSREIQNFLQKLVKVQKYLSTATLTYYGGVNYFMGISPCRLCNASNGCGEFYLEPVDNNLSKPIRWPAGLMHYYQDHEVVPSEEFYRFIMNLDLGEIMENDQQRLSEIEKSLTSSEEEADEESAPERKKVRSN